MDDIKVSKDKKPNTSEDVLIVNNIEVVYSHVILVLKGVSLKVKKGGITALLGGNGAGKSTTLKSISNLLASERGEVTKGSVTYSNEYIHDLDPSQLVKKGVIQVMEGRHCFEHLTVEENLLTGAYTRTNNKEVKEDLERVYGYFPRLRDRRTSLAGYTSGGEQQMIAIGRALMAHPTMILLDEPSMGLAPQLVKQIFEIVAEINRKEGVTILLAEQNTNMALQYAEYAYILENGRVVMEGTAESMRDNEDVKEFYLKKMYELAKKNGLSFAPTRVYKNNELIGEFEGKNKKYLSINDIGEIPCSFHPFVKRSLINKFENYRSQDVYNTAILLNKKNKVEMIQNEYYKLNIQKESVTKEKGFSIKIDQTYKKYQIKSLKMKNLKISKIFALRRIKNKMYVKWEQKNKKGFYEYLSEEKNG